jgi:hypothetical protein
MHGLLLAVAKKCEQLCLAASMLHVLLRMDVHQE